MSLSKHVSEGMIALMASIELATAVILGQINDVTDKVLQFSNSRKPVAVNV